MNEEISETPLTDERMFVWTVTTPRDGREMVSAEFARDLEREKQKAWNKYTKECIDRGTLQIEINKLKKDLEEKTNQLIAEKSSHENTSAVCTSSMQHAKWGWDIVMKILPMLKSVASEKCASPKDAAIEILLMIEDGKLNQVEEKGAS